MRKTIACSTFLTVLASGVFGCNQPERNDERGVGNELPEDAEIDRFDGGETDASSHDAFVPLDGASSMQPDGALDATIDESRPPTVERVEPASVSAGDTIRIAGSNFLPAPRVKISDRPALVLDAHDDLLSVQVPELLWSKGVCSMSVHLAVETDAGESTSLPLHALHGGPKVAQDLPLLIRAGELLAIEGTGLEEAAGWLDGVQLEKLGGGSRALLLRVPRSIAPSESTIRITSACGETEVDAIVEAARPVIVRSSSLTASPDGIVALELDLGVGEVVESVRVGDSLITSDMSGIFAINPYNRNEVAVRLPQNIGLGETDVRVVTGTDESAPILIAIDNPPMGSPPQYGDIQFVPESAVDGEYPVGTTYALALTQVGVPNISQSWYYSLNSSQCRARGTITGQEYVFDDACEHASSCSGGSTVNGNVVGLYDFDARSNSVELTIDRTVNGGDVEDYVGGWVGWDSVAEEVVPAGTEGSVMYIVVRSVLSGHQLTIESVLKGGCQ